jgi:hypothetical protein
MLGIIPGAVACVAYVCVWLAADGNLLFIYYEGYVLPTLLGAGALMGFSVGAVVGWMSPGGAVGAESWFDKASQVAPWLPALLAAASGSLTALLVTIAIDGTMEEKLDTRGLVHVSSGGAVVGSVVGVCVSFALRRGRREEEQNADA